MKIRPILFQTEMVQALLQRRKFVTRRTRGLERMNETPGNWRPCVGDTTVDKKGRLCQLFFNENGFSDEAICEYGKPRDILWVRETFQTTYAAPLNKWEYIYKADGGIWIDGDGRMPWRPSIHMPQTAARIWLRITDIRVERLADITDDSAVGEGILEVQEEWVLGSKNKWRNYRKFRQYKKDMCACSPVRSYQSLWECINGLKSWQHNPWVWVVTFEVLSTTGRPARLDNLISETGKLVQL